MTGSTKRNLFLFAALLVTPSILAAGSPCEKDYSLFPESPTHDLQSLKAGGPGDMLLDLHSAAKLIFFPYKTLSKSRDGTIRLVGSHFSSKKLAAEALGNVEAYDAKAKALGFHIPASTRIVISDKNLLPSFLGPYSESRRIFNLGDFRTPENTIVMNPIYYRTQAVADASLLTHERTHGILNATYSSRSYINQNFTVQEALADFLSMHTSGDPVIGKNALSNAPFFRDIRAGSTYDLKGKLQTPKAGELSPNDVHANSLVYSSLLWKIRSQLGAEETSRLLKPILDDLNRNYPSAALTLPAGTREFERANYEFFAASLKKTLEDHKIPITPFAELSEPSIVALSEKLKPVGTLDPGGDAGKTQTLLLHAKAAGILAVDGTLTYELVKPAPKKKQSPAKN